MFSCDFLRFHLQHMHIGNTTCAYMYAYIYTFIHLCAYIHIYIFIYIYTYKHTYTRTHDEEIKVIFTTNVNRPESNRSGFRPNHQATAFSNISLYFGTIILPWQYTLWTWWYLINVREVQPGQLSRSACGRTWSRWAGWLIFETPHLNDHTWANRVR